MRGQREEGWYAPRRCPFRLFLHQSWACRLWTIVWTECWRYLPAEWSENRVEVAGVQQRSVTVFADAKGLGLQA